MRSESRIGPHLKPDLLRVDEDGTATIEAEVENIAVKKLALERLASTPGVSGIIDRLRVRPAVPMSDAGILDDLRKTYYAEPTFQYLRIKQRENHTVVLLRDALPEAKGEIEIEVTNGVVTLNGYVPSLASKRFAGVLAWWVPGSRDVINGLAVEPPEEESPIGLEGAVRNALEKDPFVDASQVRVGVRERTVRLTGSVRSEAARNAAEWDAWYVFGVDDVKNEICVSP